MEEQLVVAVQRAVRDRAVEDCMHAYVCRQFLRFLKNRWPARSAAWSYGRRCRLKRLSDETGDKTCGQLLIVQVLRQCLRLKGMQ